MEYNLSRRMYSALIKVQRIADSVSARLNAASNERTNIDERAAHERIFEARSHR